MASSITLEHSGAYSLSRSVAVAARPAVVDELGNDRGGEAGLELAFALDDSWHAIAVGVTQSENGLSADVGHRLPVTVAATIADRGSSCPRRVGHRSSTVRTGDAPAAGSLRPVTVVDRPHQSAARTRQDEIAGGLAICTRSTRCWPR